MLNVQIISEYLIFGDNFEILVTDLIDNKNHPQNKKSPI